MSVPFKDFRATVKRIDQQAKRAVVNLSTWDKQEDGTYKYSNWGFVSFVGKANTFILEEVEEGDQIQIVKGKATMEDWTDKDGNKHFATKPQYVVFEATMHKKKSDKAKQQKQDVAEVPSEDDIPF